MLRLLEINNRLNKQASDKQMTMIYSIYIFYIVANGAYNYTRLRALANIADKLSSQDCQVPPNKPYKIN